MPRRRYAVERGGPKRLEIEWGRGTDVRVSWDGAPPTSFATSQLDAGATVPLPDGTTLFLQRTPRSWWSLELRDPLRAERLGAPLPGSDWDPLTIGRSAASLIALLGVLIGGSVALWGVFTKTRLTPGAAVVIGALVLVPLVLAALAASGMRVAIAAAALLLVAQVAFSLTAGARPSAAGIVLRALFLAQFVRAWRRMRPRPSRSSGAAAAG